MSLSNEFLVHQSNNGKLVELLIDIDHNLTLGLKAFIDNLPTCSYNPHAFANASRKADSKIDDTIGGNIR